MAEKRQQSKAQVRNLAQYKNMSEDDFEKMFEERQYSITLSKTFEDRIQKKIDEFSQDYDIDDLKINDKETLRAFVQAIISLEDYERLVFDIRTEGSIDQANINVVDRVSKMMSDLRKDISRFQEDLNITRKIRKSDKESSVVSYISNLKDQAREYYESKVSYIFCPECNMLLSNWWCLYPEEDNKITLKCNRTLDDGSKCGHKFTVTSKELLDNRGTNKISVIPEALL
jgi:hypothetical protein